MSKILTEAERIKFLKSLEVVARYRAKRYIEMLENNEKPINWKEFIKTNFGGDKHFKSK